MWVLRWWEDVLRRAQIDIQRTAAPQHAKRVAETDEPKQERSNLP